MQLTNLTRLIIPALLGLIWCTSINAQDNLIFEDFEDANVGYLTNPAEFVASTTDYFSRTNGSDINADFVLTGTQGTSFFAAQDIDAEGATLPATMEFTGDISNHVDLSFSILLAEDDDGSNQDWDNSDYAKVEYSIDGGSYLPLICVANDGTSTNAPPFIDSDCNGTGDGAEITNTFASYGALIPETGSTITIRIKISLNSGDEDIAFDNVLLTGMPAFDPADSEPPVAVCAPSGTVTAALDENGIATLNAESLDGGSTDNVAIASYEASPATFDCADIGSKPVILIVTDTNGNTATCTTDVQVVDLLGPVLSVNETITVTLDANGNAVIDANMINNGSSDNCGITAVSFSPPSLDCSNTTNLNLIASDLIISEYVEGSSNNKYIEIYNGTGEAVDMADYFIELYSNGNYSTSTSDYLGAAGILENGETAVFSNAQATIYSGAHYNTSVAGFNGNDLLMLWHVNGDQASVIDVFGIYDGNTSPSWDLGGVSTKDHTLRRKKSVATGNTNESNTNFLSEWEQFDIDDVSDLGSHNFEDSPAQVIFSATDNSGNITSTSIAVFVMDTIDPQFLTQPDDIVIPADFNGTCTQPIYYTYPNVEDNCSSEVIVTSDHPSGTLFFGGETVVTLTATDAGGNTDQVQFTVTILNDPLTVSIGSVNNTICSNYPLDLNALAFGGCQPYTYTWNGEPGNYTYHNTTAGTYNLVVTDANGDTATASITTYENPPLVLELSMINPSCSDGNDGSFSVVNISGGTAPYHYLIFGSQITEQTGQPYLNDVPSITGLHVGGSISILVQDTVGCEVDTKFRPKLEDRTPPIAICGSTTLTLNAGGTAILNPADLNGGSTDDCSASMSFSASQETFDCTNLGVNEVTLYVADDSLNTSTCLASVTVIDNLPPELLVNSSVNFTLDNAGQVVIDPTLFDNGSTDNCGITEFTVDQAALSCADLGEGPELATDLMISEYLEGSSNNKYIEIYNGTGAPVDLSNYELRRYTNGSSSPTPVGLGNAGILANSETAVFRNSSAVIYGGPSYINSAINFNGDDAVSLFNISTNQNVDIFGVIGQDPGTEWISGAKSSKDQTLRRMTSVTTGNTNPTNANFLDEWEQYDTDVISGLGGHSLSGGGGTEITFTATDASGNSASTTVTAVVTDNTPPVFSSFPEDITTNSDPANCSAIATWTAPTATDNCEATLESDHASGENFGAGVTTVTYTASDPSGNTTSQSFTITVNQQDLVAQVVIDDIVHCNGGTAQVRAEITGGCQPYSYKWDTVDGTETQTVSAGNHTLTVTDVNGNVITKDFSVTEPSPLLLSFDSTDPSCGLVADGEITAIVTGGTPSYAVIWSGNATGTGNTLSNVENGTYTATVTDLEGCTLSETVTLAGVDTIPPTLLIGNIITGLHIDDGMTRVFEPWMIDNGSYDNCGEVTLTISQNQWGCSDQGENELIVTGTDAAGNTTIRTVSVFVQDIYHPYMITQNIDLPLDASGFAHVEAADIDNGSFDNCTIVSLEITSGQVDYSCADIGQTFAVTLTATDNFGNISSKDAEVTVVDNSTPVFTFLPGDIAATANAANCSAIVSWAEPEASDNCAVTITSDYNSGDAFPIGVTTVTYTAADLSGNSATLSFTITVGTEDLLVSIANNQDILCHGGTANLTAVVSGGCQPYAYSWDGASGGESLSANVGLHTLIVTDANGAAASANVTLSEPPAILVTLSATEPSCPQISDGEVSTAVSGGTGPHSINWSGDATGSGNTLSNIGNGTYTATITDDNGCTAVESITLNGTDFTPPTAICGNATLTLDANGQATLDLNMIDGGSADNCGSVSLSASQTAYDCSDLGINEITLTATDEAGLISTCTATVTVMDNLAPTVVAQNINVSLDLTGFALVEASDIDNGSSDNCGIETLEITSGKIQYGCTDYGQTFAVTLTATDNSGNTSSAVAEVTVVPGIDSDGDGISDVCDICEGDDSLGDADGDGICDAIETCAGAETIVFPNQPCSYQTTINTSYLYATGYLNYCVDGPFTNNYIYIAAGTTVRLTGTGTLRIYASSGAAVEIMAGSDIIINSLNLGWNARGMVVNEGATVHLNNFQPGEPVVNCGTINCNNFTLRYNSSFLNNGTLNCSQFTTSNSSTFTNNGAVSANYLSLGYGSDFENNGVVYADQYNAENRIDGSLLNNALIFVNGNLDLRYNGSIDNYCTLNVAGDFNISRNVKNYSFISVSGTTELTYNGRVKLYDGAQFQTVSTKIGGRYVGYGSPSLITVSGITQASWNGRIEGSLYYCDYNGLESVSNPNSLFQGGAQESCNLTIPSTDCNPFGHIGTPLGMSVNMDNDALERNAKAVDDNTNNAGLTTNTYTPESHTQESRNAITIFPNPTEGKARITFTPLFDASVTISVYNVRGKKLEEFKPSEQFAGQPYVANLDLSHYENGIYLIQIMDNTWSETRKLVLTR